MSVKPSLRPSRIGLLVFDGVATLDLAGVLDVFHAAGASPLAAPVGAPPSRYQTLMIGLSPAAVTAESGLRLLPDVTADTAPPLDTLVIPGGPGLREPDINRAVAAFVAARAGETRRMVSVCTGLYGLAASGLADGRRVTTHWRHAEDAQRRYPQIRLEPDAIFIKDGPVYTSAGMSAGIDLALALIEEDHGPALALAAARQLVVYVRRLGGQLQYSEPLRFQTRAGDRFADLAAAMAADLGGAWTVETMAARAGLSPRQFARRFSAAFGTAPAAYVERLRLDEARLLLSSGGDSLSRIARMVGFHSDDGFRRAFERRFGVTPSVYRGRFASAFDEGDPS